MKGIVFTEFLEMVESKFGIEMVNGCSTQASWRPVVYSVVWTQGNGFLGGGARKEQHAARFAEGL